MAAKFLQWLNVVGGLVQGGAAANIALADLPAGTAKIYQTIITGDGVALSFTITHSLGNATPLVQMWTSLGVLVASASMPVITSVNANSFTAVFALAPGLGVTYTVTVVG